jgi:hypothetical protein
MLYGRPLKVKLAERNSNLVIDNLPVDVSRLELEDLLLPLGEMSR